MASGRQCNRALSQRLQEKFEEESKQQLVSNLQTSDTSVSMAQHWATKQRKGSINYLKSKTYLAKTHILVQPVHEGDKEGVCGIRGYKDSSGG